jgi:hypothetical protein
MVPVGLMWGNDTDLTPATYAMGARATQTWINPGLTPTRTPPYGRLDRLNGPVDNPLSSCLSCHARAVAPYVPSKTFPHSASEADDPAKNFFTNTPANTLFAGGPAGSQPLDYSLQLAVGVANFPGAAPAHGLPQVSMKGAPNRGDDPATAATATEPPAPAAPPTPAEPAGTKWWLWILVLVLLLLLLMLLIQRRRRAAA